MPEHHDPFSVLGMHRLESENAMVVRAYLPNAKEIEVVELSKNNTYPMEKIDERGFFEVVIKDRNDFFKYNLRATDYVGNTFTFYDPYCFMARDL